MYAGKSTIADGLADAGYQRMSFAAPLKNVAALAYGPINKTAEYETVAIGAWDVDETLLPYKVMKSGRQILQDVGQELKNVDRNFWLRCFFRDAENYLDYPLVVDDGRFMFEFRELKARGWLCVGILTPDTIRNQRAVALNGREPTPEERNHPSEVEVPHIIGQCDLQVDGTMDAYYNVRRILDLARD
jgi:hypothetical protein